MKSATALAKVRKLCLALPEAFEREAWKAPTFRVKKGVFVMFVNNHHGDGRLAIWCNAPEGAQESLVEADPDRFFRPPYVGPGGWLGVRLDRGLEWSEVGAIIEQAYRTTAARRRK